MQKNILLITGSPRKKGNSNLLADAFTKGAQSAGHTVTRFDSGTKLIGGCKACDTCWSKGKACSFSDGFDDLPALIEQADMLVICSPLYWFTFSAQLKAALDRMYGYTTPQCPKKLRIQEGALLMCAAEPDAGVFAGPAASYASLLKFMNWTDRGMVLVPGVYEKGDITKTDGLERAEKLGQSL